MNSSALTRSPIPLMTKISLAVPHPKSVVIRYAAAALLVIVVTWLRLPLGSWLGKSVPFILYFPAIVAAGWFGGLGPGLTATAVAAYCAKTWFFEPVGTFTIPDWPSAFRLLLFLLSGILISFLCGRLHDQTEQLAKEKAALEIKVAERTAHLEQSLKDMEAFSYTVSHDLRAPLRTMLGYSEALLEDHADVLHREAHQHLKRIHNAAGQLDRLISDLLAFAKVSGANIELRPVVLKDVLAAVLQSSPQLNSTDVNLQYGNCSAYVFANDTLLHQVLKNLLENAVKFVPFGVKPEINVWSEQRNGDVRVWVADNGIGISPSQQTKLFKMFERLEPTNYVGTGIGLVIVERAIAKMNGRVGVESQVGKGSKFWIELTAAESVAI
jgi:signal transduction histidine kinase